ncbi:MAG TPA: 4-phosphopantetheinyl transferase [Pseudolysinimonas sp.]|nr:4-phosphopantetheinyl transferase [Pseudolysinimonas sp.]
MPPVLRWIRPRLNRNAAEAAIAVLSPGERRRLDGLAGVQRQQFLAGRLLLRRLVAEMTGEAPADVEVTAVCPDCDIEHGKPLAGAPGLHVSLSHTADLVVAAASWDGAIGVDVEARQLTATLLRAIGSVAGEASLEHWTRVEAILKADGRGLRVDPSTVSIADVGGTLEGTVPGSPITYEIGTVDLAPGSRVSIAVAR